jgi:aryl-phospho-beta-D-glucosidase BglC (GH1 family)
VVVTPALAAPAAAEPIRSAHAATAAPSGQSPAAPSADDAMATVAAMQPGWNLGNTLDAITEETSWGNPRVTREQLDVVRAAGFKSVRIPVTWGDHQGPGPNYTIDPARMSRVKEVVDLALADDFYVLINLHHDSWEWIRDLSTDHDGVLARYTATWTQIAAAFRNAPAKLLFESVNEPQFTNATDAQADALTDEVNRAFHRVARASGGANATRLLVLPPAAGMDVLYNTITSLNDRNVVATLHYYGWWPFSVNIAGKTTFDADTKKDLVDQFARMYTTFVARGIPVIVGEWGLLTYDYTRPELLERGEVLKFSEEFGYQARTTKITTMLWDAGTFLDRPALKWRDPELIDLLTASLTTRSATASSDNLYVAKSAPITSQTLTLNPNGATFTGLRQGAKNLVRGTDYTISGNQLTVSAATLTRLVGDRAYGVNSTLYAQFSQGVSWRIDVVTYDTPVLSNATGTTSSFVIPAKLLGDRLATMEARFADGSNAGRTNWTPYKEFGACMRVDYANNTITLLPDFFTEAVRDGARMTLTFDFWSGAKVTYYVTMSGTSVTGTTT